ncbi:MAG: DEAD/DEAH box helicase [Bacilli bacterium]|nr:DEAD/DEAH box helicase [Bacilli bacterium]
MASSFKSFNLDSRLVASLTRQGYLSPSKVQELVIPKALKGANLVVKSETGSGKTHAYLIPLLNQQKRSNALFFNALIITPTNELARQVFNFLRGFKQEYHEVKVRLLSSETSEKENIVGLKETPQIVVGTPGRLASLFKKGHLKADHLETIILDEADMLLEMGYFNEIDYIMHLAHHPQLMIFSATIEANLQNRINRYIGADYEITSDSMKTSRGVSHHLIDIHHQHVNEATLAFIKNKNPNFLLILASNKNDVNALYDFLKAQKFSVIKVTGDLSDRERRAALKRINQDEFQIVVASDLMSRGMDFQNVSDVLSINLPSDLSYYFHRAGRTGRFDKRGHSYVFYNTDDTRRVESLMKQGVVFDYYSLKNNLLTVGKPFQKTFKNKKKIDPDLLREIKKAKYENQGKRVKPGYKKKVKNAINKVKQKHKRELIRKDIRRQRVERYKAEARNRHHG